MNFTINTTTTQPQPQPTTSIRKGFDKQWTATTYFPLAAPNRFLKVSTWKHSRGFLYTSSQAVIVTGDMETFMLVGDYSKPIKSFPQVKRVTDKVISTCHADALTDIQKYIDEANEFYKEEEAEAV